MNGVVPPKSWKAAATHTKWSLIRLSSFTMTRSTFVRSGISTPNMFSTARQYAILFMMAEQ